MSIPQSGGGPIEHHDQLAEYLAAGCKPRDDWRIGTEHEKFGYIKDTLLPLPYEGDLFDPLPCWKGCATRMAGTRSPRAAS